MTELDQFELLGLALKTRTVNANGQSNIDCGNLWQRFVGENYASIIPQRVSDAVYAVYHSYEGDHSQPFSFFIGCKVPTDSEVPPGLARLVVPAAKYQKVTAKGRMPDCIASTWRKIWASDLPRSYRFDFEVYDERSHDWQDAEVDIYLGCND